MWVWSNVDVSRVNVTQAIGAQCGQPNVGTQCGNPMWVWHCANFTIVRHCARHVAIVANFHVL